MSSYCSIHQEEMEHHPEIISLLQRYEGQYNWNELKSSLAIKNIGKFEKNNPGTTENVPLNTKKGICLV